MEVLPLRWLRVPCVCEGRVVAAGCACGVVLCAVCVVKLLRAHGGCLGIRSR